ncbi:POTRA domain-containing protein [Dokdonia sp. R86516]|uniref:POTRA domain-containing protein n=1 Tax=Dokdonia sp. R86516 TaxID=3093856 RepID=UPI0037CA7824
MKLIYLFIIASLFGQHMSAQKNEAGIQLQVITELASESNILSDLKYKTIFKDKLSASQELQHLSNQLKELGYLDNTYNLTTTNDSLYLAVFHLNTHYPFLHLKIDQKEVLQQYITQTGYKITEDSIKIETAFAKAYLKRLSSIASNNGYPFATFQIKNITKTDQHHLNGNLILELKKNRTIDKIKIEGYTNIPKSFIKHSIKLKEGDLFNRDKLNEQNLKIASIPFVSQTKAPQVLFTPDSTTVYLYLERKNQNKFDGFLGFTNQEDNSIELNGYLDLLLTNNFNYGETFILNYKADGRDQSQLHLKTKLPYILKTPLGIEASLNLFRKDSTFSTTQQSLDLVYQLNLKNQLTIGLISEQSENLVENTTTTTNLKDYNFKRFTASFTHQKLSSDTFFPTKRRLHIRASFGNRVVTENVDRQISFTGILENEFTLNDKHSIFAKNTTQFLISDQFLTNELYRFGGILTLRGFEENSLLANFYNTLNTEYRYKLNKSIYVNSILDLGYLENNIEKSKQKLYSFGLGTGIQTKAGILKLNIANGTFENQTFTFSDTKLHVILEVNF